MKQNAARASRLGTMFVGISPLALTAMLLVAAGCGKGEAATTGAKSGMPVAPASSETVASASGTPSVAAATPAANGAANGAAVALPSGAGCKHAACADNFFVDTAGPENCAAGASCAVTVKLVAMGEFHVNDEYPYRFKADDTPGIDFGGTDALGKSVFSKPAGDWRKADAKTGLMTVKFTPHEKGERTISGTFKLSVCSAQNCLLEQRQVSAAVLAH